MQTTLTQTEIRKSKHRLHYYYFYKKYPYKKYGGGTNPSDYVPVSERSDHKDALTLKKWKSILKRYYDYLSIYLAEGNSYFFTSKMGKLEIQKFKSKAPAPDYNKIIKFIMEENDCSYNEAKKKITKEDIERFKHNLRSTDGYRWALIWYKSSHNFKYKRYWTVILTKPCWKKMKPIVEENIHKIDLVKGVIGTHK